MAKTRGRKLLGSGAADVTLQRAFGQASGRIVRRPDSAARYAALLLFFMMSVLLFATSSVAQMDDTEPDQHNPRKTISRDVIMMLSASCGFLSCGNGRCICLRQRVDVSRTRTYGTWFLKNMRHNWVSLKRKKCAIASNSDVPILKIGS